MSELLIRFGLVNAVRKTFKSYQNTRENISEAAAVPPKVVIEFGICREEVLCI